MNESLFRVRRLAVIDLHGSAGSVLRLWLVRSEFVIAVALAAALGGVFLVSATPQGTLLGIIALGIACNYVVLAIWAFILRGARLAEEFAAHDIREDGRRISLGQWRLFVPLLLVVLAMRNCERRV
jgi:hypothetical protein